jgi:hypothetical protein
LAIHKKQPECLKTPSIKLEIPTLFILPSNTLYLTQTIGVSCFHTNHCIICTSVLLKLATTINNTPQINILAHKKSSDNIIKPVENKPPVKNLVMKNCVQKINVINAQYPIQLY